MRRIALALIFSGAVVAVGVLLWLGDGEGRRRYHSPTAPQESSTSDHDSAHPSSLRRGEIDTGAHRESLTSDAQASEPPPTLDALRQRVPRGDDPAEYVMSRFARGDDFPHWLQQLAYKSFGNLRTVDPPFRPLWLFGDSDREWLEDLGAAYKREFHILESAHSVEPHTDEDRALHDHLTKRLRVKYGAVLEEIAMDRLARAPELQQRLSDSRPLRSFPSDSEQGQWLSEILTDVWPSFLVDYGLAQRDDLRHFTAADCHELSRIRHAILEIFNKNDGLMPPNEIVRRLVAPEAARYQALLERRRE